MFDRNFARLLKFCRSFEFANTQHGNKTNGNTTKRNRVSKSIKQTLMITSFRSKEKEDDDDEQDCVIIPLMSLR
jgi:hypothetical protein